MSRRSWVYINGVAYEKGVDIIPDVGGQPAPNFIPDIDSFVSPIDGTVIGSRSQLREHCKRHDVVPTQELAGLPTQLSAVQPSKREIRERQEMIYAQVDKAIQQGKLRR
jgi:hypothetical protein